LIENPIFRPNKNNLMRFSVIIPTLNEERFIEKSINHFQSIGSGALVEIIVVDGGSDDQTIEIARNAGAKVIISPKRGRACQMNFGAQNALGDFLYFVHADVLPPQSCFDDILSSIKEGYKYGCFSYQFSSKSRWLKINTFFNRFQSSLVGGGDQTLFILKSLFEQVGGFDETYCIMEDFEFIDRTKKKHPLKIIPKDAVVSARKYESNSYLRVQIANFLVFSLYKLGVEPPKLKVLYGRLLNQ
jgi:rSAM/selenodomain-associated transferase 2